MTWWRWSPLPAPTRPLTRLASFLQMANLKLFTNGCEKIFHLGQLQVQISLRWPSSSPWPLLPSAHLTPIFDFYFNFSKKKFDLHLVDHVLGHFQGSTAIKTVPLQVLLTPICKHHEQKISPICLPLTFMVLAFNASSAIALKSFHLNSCKKRFKSILVDRRMVK